MRTITLNEHDMGCEHGDDNRVTCGTCQRSWCDKCNPTPSARCLFEYDHDEVFDEDETTYRGPLAPHGGCNWKGCRECFPDGEDEAEDEPTSFADLVEDFWLLAEPAYARFDELTKARINSALQVFKTNVDPVAEADAKRPKPEVGMVVCDCRYKHLKIVSVDGDDLILEDGHSCSYIHCTNNVPHFDWDHPSAPCPTCGEFGGFHDDAKHRNDIDPQYLKKKGWHNV